MSISKRFCTLFMFCSWSLSAAEPIGVVTAGAELKINGKNVNTVGAPNWPVVAGDELVTGGAGVVITFPDLTRFGLAPYTKVTLKSCDRCVAQLFQGSLEYSKPAGSNMEICALGHAVRPLAGTEGSVRIDNTGRILVKVAGREQVASGGRCACKAGAPWAAAASHTKLVVVVAATGATVAGTSVALTRGKEASAK
jgi:hypothetical protein